MEWAVRGVNSLPFFERKLTKPQKSHATSHNVCLLHQHQWHELALVSEFKGDVMLQLDLKQTKDLIQEEPSELSTTK